MDCTPAGFSLHGISQVRILEWGVISFFRGSSPPRIEPTSALAGRFFISKFPKLTQLLSQELGLIEAVWHWSLCSEERGVVKVKKQRNRKGDAKTRLLDLQLAVNHQSSFRTSRSEGREEEEDAVKYKPKQDRGLSIYVTELFTENTLNKMCTLFSC